MRSRASWQRLSWTRRTPCRNTFWMLRGIFKLLNFHRLSVRICIMKICRSGCRELWRRLRWRKIRRRKLLKRIISWLRSLRMLLLRWRDRRVILIRRLLSCSWLRSSRFWEIIIIRRLHRLRISKVSLRKDKMLRMKKFWNTWNLLFELSLFGFKFLLQKIWFLVWMRRV